MKYEIAAITMFKNRADCFESHYFGEACKLYTELKEQAIKQDKYSKIFFRILRDADTTPYYSECSEFAFGGAHAAPKAGPNKQTLMELCSTELSNRRAATEVSA